jgi:acyl dehydratase
MPVNPEAIGICSEPQDASWTSKDALLYAVSVGAGTDELAFTTENTADVAQRVLPTFPVVIPNRSGSLFAAIGSFNPAMLVHGTQSVTLSRPLPTDGTATLVSEVAAMYDKEKAAVVVIDTSATLGGEALFTTRSSLFIRGEGGWGGERGPSGPQNVPPDRDPDHVVTYRTSPDQALVYRLNGDRNPLHSDPSFAAMGGFDRPILHGLCTYGFTGRALLHTLCGSDPTRFGHVEGRFASPVLPGDELTISMWETSDAEAVFTTSVDDRVVIDQGLLRHT